MDRLAAMRVYVAVVEEGGFSAASRALNLPLSTVSRKIADLEDHIGAQLLVRSTRRVEITPSGWQYYQDAQHILDAVEAQERKAAGEFERPKGHLVITSPTLFGRRLLLPVAAAFMRRHPDITIRLQLTNTIVDLMAEHVDLGVRIGRLSDSSQVALKAGSVREVICAGPGYLAAMGRPRVPAEIADHHCITYAHSEAPKEWEFRAPAGD